MAKIQFLTILLAVTCFLGGVISVTDKEFEDLVAFVHQQATKLDEHTRTYGEQSVTVKEQSVTIQEQTAILEQQSVTIQKQSRMIEHLRKENRVMKEDNKRQDCLIEELDKRMMNCDVAEDDTVINERNLTQNTTIEERVTLLEIQVLVIQDNIVGIQDDVTQLDEDVTLLEGDVNFLFDEQVIQDERLLNLEETSDGIISELDAVEDNLENLDDVTSDLETRLTVAEEDIQGLQMTDVKLVARVTAVEETIGDIQNDTIAFHTVLTIYDTIPDESVVLFDEVLLNEGDGYDSTTGTFIVPFGGDGIYYFSAYLLGNEGESSDFDIQINENVLCTVHLEQHQQTDDFLQSACSAATNATQGDVVQVVYRQGTDTTPLVTSTTFPLNGFNGFRI